MKHKGYSKPRAYDEARREFYKHRHLEDIRRQIAKEEALQVGAYFGKGPLEIGMKLEDNSFENWKRWAERQIEDEQQMRAQLFSGPQTGDDMSAPELEEALEEVQTVVPQSKEGQPALGGAALHP
jgi:small subunit ribosomal protein S23